MGVLLFFTKYCVANIVPACGWCRLERYTKRLQVQLALGVTWEQAKAVTEVKNIRGLKRMLFKYIYTQIDMYMPGNRTYIDNADTHVSVSYNLSCNLFIYIYA